MKKPLILLLLMVLVLFAMVPISRNMVQAGVKNAHQPWAGDTAFTGAEILFRFHRFTETQESLDRILPLFPQHPNVPMGLYWRAVSYEHQGDFQAALKDYETLKAKHRMHPLAYKAKLRAKQLKALLED